MHEGAVVTGLIRQVLGGQRYNAPSEPNWRAVCEIAARHRVAPLLYALPQGILPEEVRGWAQRAALQSAQRAIQFRRVLGRLSGRVEALKIPCLVFKGAALHDWAYGELTRAAGDIDVCVEASNLPRMVRELEGMGFQNISPRRARKSGAEQGGVWQDPLGNTCDLHTTIIEPYFSDFLSFSELWENRTQIPSISLPTLQPSHHFLLLLLHGAKHQWCRLSWIVDVVVAANKLDQADWSEVLRLMYRTRTQRVCSVGLRLCHSLFPVEAAQRGSLLASDSPRIRSLVVEYQRRLYLPLLNTKGIKVSNSILHLRALEGVFQKVRYVAARLGHLTA
jgi:hypothetical protein